MAGMRGFVLGLCVLGASATARRTDSVELVQMSLQETLMQASNRSQAPLEMMTKVVLQSMLADGKRMSNFLFGQSSAHGGASPKVHCSRDDRTEAATALSRMEQNLEKLASIIPEVAKNPPGYLGLLRAPVVPLSDGKMTLPMPLGDFFTFPGECSTLFMGGKLTWSKLQQCAEHSLNLTSSCSTCLPNFGREVREACAASCAAVMEDSAEPMQVAIGDAVRTMSRMYSTDSSSLTSLGEKMSTGVHSVFQKAKPCVLCLSPKVASLAGCIGGRTWESNTALALRAVQKNLVGHSMRIMFVSK